MTLAIELDLDKIKVDHRVKYLGQRSFKMTFGLDIGQNDFVGKLLPRRTDRLEYIHMIRPNAQPTH